MAAQVGDILSLDVKYIVSLLDPVAAWGKQPAHDANTGIYAFASTTPRTLPYGPNEETNEMIHASVLEQKAQITAVTELVKKYPKMVTALLPLEVEIRRNWPYNSAEDTNGLTKTSGEPVVTSLNGIDQVPRRSLLSRAKDTLTKRMALQLNSAALSSSTDPVDTVGRPVSWGWFTGRHRLENDGEVASRDIKTAQDAFSFSQFGSFMADYLAEC